MPLNLLGSGPIIFTNWGTWRRKVRLLKVLNFDNFSVCWAKYDDGIDIGEQCNPLINTDDSNFLISERLMGGWLRMIVICHLSVDGAKLGESAHAAEHLLLRRLSLKHHWLTPHPHFPWNRGDPFLDIDMCSGSKNYFTLLLNHSLFDLFFLNTGVGCL